MTGYVYFMGNFEARAVKVGYAANPRGRLSEIGVSSPHRIELLACVPGTRADEAALHKALRRDALGNRRRMHGEWFKWDLITHELIERAQLGAPIEELIDFATGRLFETLGSQRTGCLIAEIETGV